MTALLLCTLRPLHIIMFPVQYLNPASSGTHRLSCKDIISRIMFYVWYIYEPNAIQIDYKITTFYFIMALLERTAMTPTQLSVCI
jgi:hypothetical protein